MPLRLPTCALLLVLLAPAAGAVHESGASWEVVGFSGVGSVLMRLTDVQHGVIRYEIRATEGGAPLLVRGVSPGEDAAVLEATLRAEHGIVSPGFAGPRSPILGAALLVAPGPLGRDGAFAYQLLLADGLGRHVLDPIPIDNECPPETGGQAHLDVRWSPDGGVAVLAGDVSVQAPCGQPTAVPVLRFVHPRAPTPLSVMDTLATSLLDRARQLERTRPAEAIQVARQAVALAPDRPRARILLARLRALTGDPGGSLSALWSLVGLAGGEGLAILDQGLASPWTADLRRRASFQALRWVVQEHRAAAGPPPTSKPATP